MGFFSVEKLHPTVVLFSRNNTSPESVISCYLSGFIIYFGESKLPKTAILASFFAKYGKAQLFAQVRHVRHTPMETRSPKKNIQTYCFQTPAENFLVKPLWQKREKMFDFFLFSPQRLQAAQFVFSGRKLSAR